jgi:hypothetical protein
MNNFKGRTIPLLAKVLAISAVATRALSSELNHAAIRTVYDEDVTWPIAKSLLLRVITSAGDLLAVVQCSSGAWALALVPRGLDERERQVVELVSAEARSFDTGNVGIVRMLMREQPSPLVARTAKAN